VSQEVLAMIEAPDVAGKGCAHGGAFFSAVGEDLDDLSRAQSVVNADVLDAWFPPAPGVIAALREHLPWLTRTSPPTTAAGMQRAIARARGVEPECVLPGAGSSALIFLALRHWLDHSSRVLILDPCYGEYPHVLREVIGCRVDTLGLDPEAGFGVDLGELERRLAGEYDLVVLINPNNPTGVHLPREALERVLGAAPTRTRFWIDEAYVDYVSSEESLERFAVGRGNVVVSKSMSKVYALSGLRAAYLCGSAGLLRDLRRITPPWAVSLPAQTAAVEALRDPEYYCKRYAESHRLRGALAAALRALPVREVSESAANWLLVRLREVGPTAKEVAAACARENVFIRDMEPVSGLFRRRTLRIAVKDRAGSHRIVRAVARTVGDI
jgi:histidinol-phosphate/aromatic aminotransferase/cobyric acid decarboxylase-like protein